MSEDPANRDFFRCPVQAEQATATIKCGLRRIPVTLRETSIDGFTVVVAARYAGQLRVGTAWTLITKAERNIVHGEWIFMSPEGSLQLGLRRIQDITPIAQPRGSWLPKFLSRRQGKHSSPEILLVGVILVIIIALSSPGMGDTFGTASKIRRFVTEVIGAIRSFIP